MPDNAPRRNPAAEVRPHATLLLGLDPTNDLLHADGGVVFAYCLAGVRSVLIGRLVARRAEHGRDDVELVVRLVFGYVDCRALNLARVVVR